jgi:hypothetical protein
MTASPSRSPNFNFSDGARYRFMRRLVELGLKAKEIAKQ